MASIGTLRKLGYDVVEAYPGEGKATVYRVEGHGSLCFVADDNDEAIEHLADESEFESRTAPRPTGLPDSPADSS